jgi:hypothetical protein
VTNCRQLRSIRQKLSLTLSDERKVIIPLLSTLSILDVLEKEAKWAKELAERDAVVKEVAEKKMEVKFIDADI